jgi:predicted small secreted protein
VFHLSPWHDRAMPDSERVPLQNRRHQLGPSALPPTADQGRNTRSLLIHLIAKDHEMRKNISIALTLLMLSAAMPLLAACHTTAGAGEDLSATGHAITNDAQKHTP